MCVFCQTRGSGFVLYPILSADWYEGQDDKYLAANRIYFPLEPLKFKPQPAQRNSTPSMMLHGKNSA